MRGDHECIVLGVEQTSVVHASFQAKLGHRLVQSLCPQERSLLETIASLLQLNNVAIAFIPFGRINVYYLVCRQRTVQERPFNVNDHDIPTHMDADGKHQAYDCRRYCRSIRVTIGADLLQLAVYHYTHLVPFGESLVLSEYMARQRLHRPVNVAFRDPLECATREEIFPFRIHRLFPEATMHRISHCCTK